MTFKPLEVYAPVEGTCQAHKSKPQGGASIMIFVYLLDQPRD